MDPSARIGLVCLHTDPYAAPGSGDVGGMNVVVRQTAAAMARLGARIEVVTRWADPAAPPVEEIDGVLVHRLVAGPVRPVPKGVNETFVEEFARQLTALGRFDLLHSQHWFSGAAALDVARSWGVPHVQSFHSIAAPPATELAQGERPESPGRLAGEARLARESDGIVAVSHAEQRTAVERLGAEPARVRVVHPGVDVDLFHPATSSTSQRPRLLVAARLEPLKGVDLAIEALAELRRDTSLASAGSSWAVAPPVLRIAGGATADRAFVDSLVALAERQGVADDVELLGPLSRTASPRRCGPRPSSSSRRTPRRTGWWRSRRPRAESRSLPATRAGCASRCSTARPECSCPHARQRSGPPGSGSCWPTRHAGSGSAAPAAGSHWAAPGRGPPG